MAQSSSSSGSSSRRGGGGGGIDGPGYGGLGSPVRYRIGPLAYQSPVFCKCKPRLKAARWISWSIGEPGRRFYRCTRARTDDDCKFFEWVDEECNEWYKEVLGDLRDAVWDLRKELRQKVEEMNAKESMLVAKQMQLDEKQQEVEEKKQEVEMKQQELFALQQLVNAMQHQLNANHEEVAGKQLELEAMKALVNKKNKCIDMMVVLCLVLVISLVVTMMSSK